MKKIVWTLTAVLMLLAAGLFLYESGFFRAASSVQSLKEYIESFSPYSHIVFFLVQLFSVVLAPIPSNITATAGGVLFGTWPAFFLTAGAVLGGSVLVFSLARLLGGPFAERLVSRKLSERYLDIIRGKRDAFLVLAFLFPYFPDDVLCILAGLTDVPSGRFILIVLLTRPWGLLFASALGGAAIRMPLWLLILFGLAGIALFLLGLKYAERLENWLTGKLNRNKEI